MHKIQRNFICSFLEIFCRFMFLGEYSVRNGRCYSHFCTMFIEKYMKLSTELNPILNISFRLHTAFPNGIQVYPARKRYSNIDFWAFSLSYHQKVFDIKHKTEPNFIYNLFDHSQ